MSDRPVDNGVSANHMPGDKWTMGAGQGCAPGYVNQMLSDGSWTCISAADFAKVQAGDLSVIAAAELLVMEMQAKAGETENAAGEIPSLPPVPDTQPAAAPINADPVAHTNETDDHAAADLAASLSPAPVAPPVPIIPVIVTTPHTPEQHAEAAQLVGRVDQHIPPHARHWWEKLLALFGHHAG